MFIEEHATEFSFTPDNRLVWSGKSADYGSEYQAPPDAHRCRVTRVVKDEDGGEVLASDHTPLLARCHRWAMRGAAVCLDCANGSAAVKRAVQGMLLSAAPALAGRLIAMAMDPTADPKEVLKAILAVLDRSGIRGGIEIAPDVPGWQKLLTSMMEDNDDEPNAGTEGR